MKTILYLLLLVPLLLTAQINESDTLKVKAKLGLTGFWQGGNVETLIFRAKSEFSIKPYKKWVFKTTNSYVYQEFGKVKADSDILSLNFLYLNPQKKLYPLVLAIASSNFRREIEIRSLFGAGITYQLIHKKNNWLKCSISSEYEQTRFKNDQYNITDYNNNKNINTWRSTLWVNGKHQLFKNKLIVNHEVYIQPSLERSNNLRWQADIGLELPLFKYLNFKINYLYTYESIVIANQKEEDSLISLGFTIKSFKD